MKELASCICKEGRSFDKIEDKYNIGDEHEGEQMSSGLQQEIKPYKIYDTKKSLFLSLP